MLAANSVRSRWRAVPVFAGLGEPNVRTRWGRMKCALCGVTLIISFVALVLDAGVHAQEPEPAKEDDPDRIRGIINAVHEDSIVIVTDNGESVTLGMKNGPTVFKLSKASFTDLDFGAYVGASSVKLDEFSPIIRDSASYLHRGFELRIIDESLRGIALGHTVWDLTEDSVMSHGWVDDLEIRVLSIKYGPTEFDETDVLIPRDAPVYRMSLGDESLVTPGGRVFAGARDKSSEGYQAVFLFVGEDGVEPAL